MGRNVSFTITGNADAAINALKKIETRLDVIAGHQAFRNMTTQLNASTTVLRRMTRQFRDFRQGMVQVNQQSRQFRQNFANIGQGMGPAARTMQQIAQAQRQATNSARQHTRAAKQTSAAYQVTLNVLRRVQGMARGLGQATAGFRGASTQVSGGIQSSAIAMRMSGIALGNQLAQVMNQTLTGNVFSPVLEALRQTLTQGAGILTIGTEMGVRLVTGLAGSIVKLFGPLVGGALQAGLTTIGALLGKGGLLSPVMATFASIGFAAQNVLTGITNIAGEIVIQFGNAFAGLAEVARGAFQAVVNVASSLLNQLLTVVQEVVGQIASVLGTIGKAVLGTAGTLAGLSIREIVKTEGSLTEALILLDPKVTPAQKDALRKWAFNMRREFANLPGNVAGDVLEMFVSTGFQSKPEQASQFASAAMKLASATGEQNGQEIARAMAKGYNLYQGEIDAAAQRLGTNPAELLADSFFNLRNYSDLTMGEIANRFAEVLGIGKQFKLTFEEIAQTTAGVSLALGAEQTFTGVQQLFESLRKLRDEGAGILKREGIQFKDLTDAEKSRLEVLQKQREEIAGQVDGVDALKAKIKEMTAEKGLASAEGDKARAGVLRKQIAEARVQLLKLESQGAGGALKGIDDEIDRITNRGGFLTNILKTLDQIEAKIKSGEISQFEARDIIPNIRALRALAAQLGLDEALRAEVKAGVTFDQAAGSTNRAQVTREQELGFQLKSIYKEVTQPFISLYEEYREPILGFFKDVVRWLKEANQIWTNLLAAPGADAFFQNLGDKLGLTGASFDFGSIDPTKFWDTMSSGIDAVEEGVQRVIGFFTTLAGLVADLAKGSEFLKSVWETIKDIAGGAGEIALGLSEGDTGPLDAILDKIRVLWTDIKTTALEIINQIASVVQQVVASVGGLLGGAGDFTSGLPSVGQVAAGAGTYGALRYFLGGSGGGAGAASAAGGGMGVAGAAGSASLGYRFGAGLRGAAGAGLRFAGPIAGAFTAYDHLTTSPDEVTPGGSLLRAGGAALTGGAIGGPWGAAIGAAASLIVDGAKALGAALSGPSVDEIRQASQMRAHSNLAPFVGQYMGDPGRVPFLENAIANSQTGDRVSAEALTQERVRRMGQGQVLWGDRGELTSISSLPESDRALAAVIAQMQKVVASNAPQGQKEYQLQVLEFQRQNAKIIQQEIKAREELVRRIQEEKDARRAEASAQSTAAGVAQFADSGSFAYGSPQARAADRAKRIRDTAAAEGRRLTSQERVSIRLAERSVSRQPPALGSNGQETAAGRSYFGATRRGLQERSAQEVYRQTGRFPEDLAASMRGERAALDASAGQRERRITNPVTGQEFLVGAGQGALPFDPQGRVYANQMAPVSPIPKTPEMLAARPHGPGKPGPKKPGEPSGRPFGMSDAAWKSLSRTEQEQAYLLATGKTERLTSRQGLFGVQSIEGGFTPTPKLTFGPGAALGEGAVPGTFGFRSGSMGKALGIRPSLGGIGGMVSGRELRERGISGFGGFTQQGGDAQQRRLYGKSGGRPGGKDAPYGFVSGSDDYDKFLEGYFKQRKAETEKPLGGGLGTEEAGTGTGSTAIVEALKGVAEKVGDPEVQKQIEEAAKTLQTKVNEATEKSKASAEATANAMTETGNKIVQNQNEATETIMGGVETMASTIADQASTISDLRARVEALESSIQNAGE